MVKPKDTYFEREQILRNAVVDALPKGPFFWL